MPTVKELKEWLNKNYKDEDTIAYALWTVDDVKSVETSVERVITTEEAEEILELVHHRHDANQGISWVEIECAIDSFFKEKDKE